MRNLKEVLRVSEESGSELEMAGNSGTPTSSDKADRVISRNGSMPPFVKEEMLVLGNVVLAIEEPMMTSEYATLKEKYELLREEHEFERSEKMRLQKELRELEEQYLGLKREMILLREENSRRKCQRERYEKLLEEMKTKERKDKGRITEMRDEIHELSLAKERAEMELVKWKSKLGELEKMLEDVVMDCSVFRSMYQDEMNKGVSCDVGVGTLSNVGTGETNGILGLPRTENTGKGGNNKLDQHNDFADEAADPNENNTLMEKDADVIEISDSEEDENLRRDRRDRNRSNSLERNQTDGKRPRISPDRIWDSVSSSKTGGRISNLGFPPSHSCSSSSTDTSSSDSDAGDPNRYFLAWSKIDEQQFLKRL